MYDENDKSSLSEVIPHFGHLITEPSLCRSLFNDKSDWGSCWGERRECSCGFWVSVVPSFNEGWFASGKGEDIYFCVYL